MNLFCFNVFRSVSPLDGESIASRKLKRNKDNDGIEEWKEWVASLSKVDVSATLLYCLSSMTPQNIMAAVR